MKKKRGRKRRGSVIREAWCVVHTRRGKRRVEGKAMAKEKVEVEEAQSDQDGGGGEGDDEAEGVGGFDGDNRRGEANKPPKGDEAMEEISPLF